MDYRGVPIDLTKEFTVVTDTSSEDEDDDCGAGAERKALIPPAPPANAMPKTVAKRVQDLGQEEPDSALEDVSLGDEKPRARAKNGTAGGRQDRKKRMATRRGDAKAAAATATPPKLKPPPD